MSSGKIIQDFCHSGTFFLVRLYAYLYRYLDTSVVDPNGIHIQDLCGSVFGIRIRIHTGKYSSRGKWRKIEDINSPFRYSTN